MFRGGLQSKEPFYNDFYVQILDKMQPSTVSHGKTKREPSGKDGNSEKDISHFDIPTPLEIKKDDWPIHDFNEESALKVMESIDGTYDFYINIDNKYLLAEQRYQKIDPKLLKARYSYGMVLIGLAILHESKNHSEDDTVGNNNERDIQGYVYDVTKAISSILLPMISGLSELEINENEN